MENVSYLLELEVGGFVITNNKFTHLFIYDRHLLQTFQPRPYKIKHILIQCQLKSTSKDKSVTFLIEKIYVFCNKDSKTSIDKKYCIRTFGILRFRFRLKVPLYYYLVNWLYLSWQPRKTIKFYNCLATLPVISCRRLFCAIHFKPSKSNLICGHRTRQIPFELWKCIIYSAATVRNNAPPLVNSTSHTFQKVKNNKSKASRSNLKGFFLFYLLYVAQVISNIICEINQRKHQRTNKTFYNKKVQKHSHYKNNSNFCFLRDIKSLFLTCVIFSRAIVWTNGEIQTLNITNNTTSKLIFVKAWYQINRMMQKYFIHFLEYLCSYFRNRICKSIYSIVMIRISEIIGFITYNFSLISIRS